MHDVELVQKGINKAHKNIIQYAKEIKNGYIKLTEIAHHTKDRIITAIYGNYFFSMKEVNMLKENQDGGEFDENSWSWMANSYW